MLSTMVVMFAILGGQRADFGLAATGPGTTWCSTIQSALAWADHTNKPILAAGFGSFRGVGFLQDPSFDYVLARCVPVEMKTYGDLCAVGKSLPASGRPTIVILDKNRRLLKRMSGMVRPSDLLTVLNQISWMRRQGDEILREVRSSGATGDEYADAATIYAMRGDTRQSQSLVAKARAKHATAGRLALACEALADEFRVAESGEGTTSLPRARQYYRAVLALRPDPILSTRVRLRLASCLYRAGEVKGAYAELQKVLESPTSVEDTNYARMLLSRFQSGFPPPSTVGRPAS